MKKGLFITFEGPEGSGKSTQIQKAAEFIKRSGKKVIILREPGSTRISEAIRSIILNPEFEEMHPHTELLLYLASRAQLVEEKIFPALNKGIYVLCDRFEDSTLAYQGYGRGMNIHKIQSVSRDFVRSDLIPDITFLLSINVRQGMRRGGRRDRMEKASWSFHQNVFKGFQDMAKRQKRRYQIIDASRSIEEVSESIQTILAKVI